MVNVLSWICLFDGANHLSQRNLTLLTWHAKHQVVTIVTYLVLEQEKRRAAGADHNQVRREDETGVLMQQDQQLSQISPALHAFGLSHRLYVYLRRRVNEWP